MINAMQKASSRQIAYEVGPRREGDIATCYAETSKAEKLLKWTAKKNLDDMCTGKLIWKQ